MKLWVLTTLVSILTFSFIYIYICTSHTSYAQVLELPQSHFDDNRECTLLLIITYVLCPSFFCKIWAVYVTRINMHIYNHIYIHIYICIYYICYIYHIVRVICLISKRRYFIVQNGFYFKVCSEEPSLWH